MGIFGVTAEEVKKKLVPFASGDATFDISDDEDADMTEDDCLAVVATQEDRVLSMLPDRYRALMTRVDGEIAVKSAAGGQMTCKASLLPVVEGTLQVFKNFPRSRAWVDRRDGDAMASEEYSLNEETGMITFAEALNEGDVIELVYEHEAAAGLTWLRECVIAFAAIEISLRFDYFSNADGLSGRIKQWEDQTVGYLRDMRRPNGPGIAAIDAVQLRGETRGKSLAKILGVL